MLHRFISWLYISQVWGPRCPEFNRDCPTCQRWREHDEIFEE